MVEFAAVPPPPSSPARPRPRPRGAVIVHRAPQAAYLPAVEVSRGPAIESIHWAAIAVADATGRLVARLGGVDHIVFLRSSAKPLQAMAVVESGAVERFGLTSREIAVMAGSHSSEPDHVEAVGSILAKIGLPVSALQCGTHTPFSRQVAENYRRAGRPFTPLEHNCSGKHAGMLAAALAGGHDPRNYLEVTHPVQRRVIGMVADLTGRMRDRVVTAVDGCGAPTLGVSLAEAARAFARLAAPETIASAHQAAARAVIAAMREHPTMVGGMGMLDTELTAHPRAGVFAKRGAEGVQCAGFRKDQTGLGLAAKVADGDNGRARVALTLEALRQLGVLQAADLDRMAEAASLVVRNNSGREVGQVRAAFTLTLA